MSPPRPFLILLAAALASPGNAVAARIAAVSVKTGPASVSGFSVPSAAGSGAAPGTSLAAPSPGHGLPNAAAPFVKSAQVAETTALPEFQASVAAPADDASMPGGPVETSPERLWTQPVPARQAAARLRKAKWETFKFFFGSRVELLRRWVKDQEEQTRGRERAVRDLEGMWTAWRTKGMAGKIQTSGPLAADRRTVRREAEKVYDKYFPKDPGTREAFRRYLDRVDAYVPERRPSNYRKYAFGIFFETPTKRPEDVRPYIEAKLSRDQVEAIETHRKGPQQAILASFKEAADAAILAANKTLPEGKKIVAVILLGSYAIGESTPKSDVDYQLITQDGGDAAMAPFADALDRLWTENRLETIEAFQFTLPPSPDVVRKSFLEGYQVISPDPAAVAALTFEVRPEPATAWTRTRGKLFEWLYASWVWLYFRAADIKDALSR